MNKSNLSNTKLWVFVSSCLLLGGLVVGSLAQTPKVFALSDQAALTQPVSAVAGSNVDSSNQTTPNSEDSGSTDTPSTPSVNTSQTTVQPTDTSGSDTASTDTSTAPSSDTSQTTVPPTDGSQSNTFGATTNSSSDPSGQPAGTLTDPSNQPDTQNGSSAGISNNIDSQSQTGNATVAHSQSGGNATTGTATASALLINEIQTTTESSANPWQTNNDNITGNYTGNIDLPIVGASQDVAPTDIQSSTNGSNTNQIDSSISNYLTLAAESGNAKVYRSRNGGNATTGNATADAELLNLINSSITDEQSFVDVINILGNLDGNIYIPPGLVNSLSDPSATPSSSALTSNEIDNYIINNQVNLTAQSGNATVTNDNSGGNATTGNASTDLQLFNLINSELTGGNALLVLVNVNGTWTGSLLGSPAGTTSALFASSLQNDTNTSAATPSSDNSSTTETINNDLSISAISGNATVAHNRVGGNATTGNAQANADIINILGDQINLSGWLGILIINVFGNWNGSLMVTPVSTTANVTTNTVSPSSSSANGGIITLKAQGLAAVIYNVLPSSGVSSSPQVNTASAVLSDSAVNTHPLLTLSKANRPLSRSSINLLTPLLFALALGLVVIDQIITFQRRKSEQ